MDHYATLPGSVESVFAHVATPGRLGDWLCNVTYIDTGPDAPTGFGTTFTLTLDRVGGELVEAEVIAYEPPWLIAYRLVACEPWVLRLTCTAYGDQTRLHLHQTDRPDALTIDLAGLARAFSATGPATPQSPLEKDF
ncbi:hypothetical protein [Kribbella sp. NPDC004536]|uniref:hypothetical protein n=1 Tax=Kribbella sp. NPDC004536 TaxID=3364106 RepID=UPI0036B7BEC1